MIPAENYMNRNAEGRRLAVAFFGEGYLRKNRPGHAAPHPTCALCGMSYGVRLEVVEVLRLPIGAPVPPHDGPLLLIEEWLSVGYGAGPGDTPGAILRRKLWDGVSYVSRSGSDPFCTTLCATKFAKAAYAAGCRIDRGDRS